jgi:hypothetical protein
LSYPAVFAAQFLKVYFIEQNNEFLSRILPEQKLKRNFKKSELIQQTHLLHI